MGAITISVILVAADGWQGTQVSAITLDTTLYFFLCCGSAEALGVVRLIKVDLLLITCQSPESGGAAICQHLHALSGLHDIPTILTKYTREKDRVFQLFGLLEVGS